MDSILDYFISLQESEPAELPERAIERWNKRADFWEDARKKKEKGDELFFEYHHHEMLQNSSYPLPSTRQKSIQ